MIVEEDHESRLQKRKRPDSKPSNVKWAAIPKAESSYSDAGSRFSQATTAMHPMPPTSQCRSESNESSPEGRPSPPSLPTTTPNRSYRNLVTVEDEDLDYSSHTAARASSTSDDDNGWREIKPKDSAPRPPSGRRSANHRSEDENRRREIGTENIASRPPIGAYRRLASHRSDDQKPNKSPEHGQEHPFPHPYLAHRNRRKGESLPPKEGTFFPYLADNSYAPPEQYAVAPATGNPYSVHGFWEDSAEGEVLGKHCSDSPPPTQRQPQLWPYPNPFAPDPFEYQDDHLTLSPHRPPGLQVPSNEYPYPRPVPTKGDPTLSVAVALLKVAESVSMANAANSAQLSSILQNSTGSTVEQGRSLDAIELVETYLEALRKK